MESESKSCSVVVDLHEPIINFLESNFNALSLKDKLPTYPEDVLQSVQRKLDEIEEIEEFKYKTFILKLVKIYELLSTKESEKALTVIEELENEIDSLDKKECTDKFYKRISSSLNYQISSFKLYALLIKDNPDEAMVMLKDMTTVSAMNNSNQAGMYGILATMLIEYGISGTKLAMTYAKKARDLDPENPYWYFLIGKILGRRRRNEKWFEIPSEEEISSFKKAIELGEHYIFILFAAELYAETANRMYQVHSASETLHGRTVVTIDELNKEASVLYRKCYELRPDHPPVLFRVAKGFLRLPISFKNPSFAKVLLEKGLEKAPLNPFGNHLMAQYWERCGKDLKIALKYLETCVQLKVFGAHMDMLRISYNHTGNFDVKALEEMLSLYEENVRRAQIFTQLASYCVFIANDLVKACEYVRECLKMEYQDNLQNHRSIFIIIKEKISLIDVIVDDIKHETEKNCSSDKMLIYQEFFNDLAASNIKLPEGRFKHLKREILKKNTQLKTKYSHKTAWNSKRNFNKARVPYLGNNVSKSNTPVPVPVVEEMNVIEKTINFFDSWTDDIRKTDTANKSDIL